jgi:hypothetical protein
VTFAGTVTGGDNGYSGTAGGTISAGDAVFVLNDLEIRDVAQDTNNAVTYDTNPITKWFAQTFTTDYWANQVVAVRWTLLDAGGGTCTASIRNTSAGLPTGADIESKTATTPALAAGAQGYWVTFSTPVSVEPNTVYAAVARCTGTGAKAYYANTNPYAGGQYITSADSGSSWTATAGNDFEFAANASSTLGVIFPTIANGAIASSYNNFIGFASNAATKGSTVNVVTTGAVSGLSGLTIGKTYYLGNATGTISVTAGTNSRKVGVSVSTTQLVVKHDNP